MRRALALLPLVLVIAAGCGGDGDDQNEKVVCGGKEVSVIEQRLKAAGYDIPRLFGVGDNSLQPEDSENNWTTVGVKLPGFPTGANVFVYCSPELAQRATGSPSEVAPALVKVIGNRSYGGLPSGQKATAQNRAAFDAFVKTAEGAKPAPQPAAAPEPAPAPEPATKESVEEALSDLSPEEVVDLGIINVPKSCRAYAEILAAGLGEDTAFGFFLRRYQQGGFEGGPSAREVFDELVSRC
jgi:hypothetical protein